MTCENCLGNGHERTAPWILCRVEDCAAAAAVRERSRSREPVPVPGVYRGARDFGRFGLIAAD